MPLHLRITSKAKEPNKKSRTLLDGQRQAGYGSSLLSVYAYATTSGAAVACQRKPPLVSRSIAERPLAPRIETRYPAKPPKTCIPFSSLAARFLHFRGNVFDDAMAVTTASIYDAITEENLGAVILFEQVAAFESGKADERLRQRSEELGVPFASLAARVSESLGLQGKRSAMSMLQMRRNTPGLSQVLQPEMVAAAVCAPGQRPLH
jgi:hypothetical protein